MKILLTIPLEPTLQNNRNNKIVGPNFYNKLGILIFLVFFIEISFLYFDEEIILIIALLLFFFFAYKYGSEAIALTLTERINVLKKEFEKYLVLKQKTIEVLLLTYNSIENKNEVLVELVSVVEETIKDIKKYSQKGNIIFYNYILNNQLKLLLYEETFLFKQPIYFFCILESFFLFKHVFINKEVDFTYISKKMSVLFFKKGFHFNNNFD